MSYGKSYRYRGYSRKGVRRYRRSVLSNRRVFGNRSARSQALQIAALRNRVNKVSRACKPERKVAIDTTVGQYGMDSSVAGDNDVVITSLAIPVGNTDRQRIGDKIYRKDTYYFTFEYHNTSDTGYHSSESAGTTLRVICGQYKSTAGSTDAPAVSDLISLYGTSGSPMTISAIAPLVNGITRDFKIFKDFKFNITTNANQHTLKVSTPWYLCRSDGAANSKHTWCWVVANGLHHDSNFTEYVLLTAFRKTVFTDA